MMFMFGSAFFTDIIGVHAIFGMYVLLTFYSFVCATAPSSSTLTEVLLYQGRSSLDSLFPEKVG